VNFEAASAGWIAPIERLATAWAEQEGGPVVGTVRCGSGVDAQPEGPPDISNGGVEVWATSDVPFVTVEDLRFSMPDANTLAVEGAPSTERRALHLALPVALGSLLANADLWVVHGAAASRPSDGAAVLVSGSTGAGKSTTAAAALHAQWSVLGDDLAVLRAREGGFDVMGVPQRLALPPELKEAGIPGTWIEGDPRNRWTPDRQPPASGWFPLRAVLLLAHGSDAISRVEPILQVDMLRTLWNAYFPAVFAAHLRRWYPVAARVARLPAWRLETGSNPETRLATIGDCLEQVLDAQSTTALV
jgi:hypothetical protein